MKTKNKAEGFIEELWLLKDEIIRQYTKRRKQTPKEEPLIGRVAFEIANAKALAVDLDCLINLVKAEQNKLWEECLDVNHLGPTRAVMLLDIEFAREKGLIK